MQLHWFYIVGLLIIVLIIFGPGRLPELGGAVGKAMREFRKATTEITNEMTATVQSTAPAPTVQSTAPAPTPAPPPPAQPASQESPGTAGSQSEATSPKT